MIHLVAMAGMVCVMVVPRLITGLRGLLWFAVASVGLVALVWFAWAVGMPLAADRARVLLIGAPVAAALIMGLVVRAVVLLRGWPMLPDVVLTAGGAALLIVSYLRLFDLI